MSRLTLQIVLVVTTLYQASSAPLGGGQVATRDHPRENPTSQSELRLETELREKAEGHVPIKSGVSENKVPASRAHQTPGILRTAPVSNGPVRGGFREVASDSRAVEERQSSEDNAKSSSTSEESDQKDIVPSLDDLSAETEAELAEEEEFLRTIISTLRDNPGLLKALIESDREAEDEEFYKQKSRVSDPGESEVWKSFQRPSPQVQKTPKQVVKKTGQYFVDGKKDSSQEEDSSEEQIPTKIDEVHSEEDDSREDKTQSESVLSGKQSEDLTRQQGNGFKVNQESRELGTENRGEAEHQRNTAVEEALANNAGHVDEQLDDSDTRFGSANKARQQPSDQTEQRIPNVSEKIHGDNNESELEALSKLRAQTRNSKEKQKVRPHM